MTGNGEINSTPVSTDKRFGIAVDSFIDLYKFIMVLAIGNCVRCLAERQIQPNLAETGGIQIRLGTVSLIDGMMVLLAMIFIIRFFLGDLAYWKCYTDRNKKVQVTDALNLLLNSFLLTYMSFFISYSHVAASIMFLLLGTEVIWGILRWIEGLFRRSDGPLSNAVNAGLILSAVTVTVVGLFAYSGILPSTLPNGHGLSDNQNRIVIWILVLNNVCDLFINGSRYLGGNDNPLLLTLTRRDKSSDVTST